MLQRSSGVLMHISSLPENYGIGTFGKEAYLFVDFLRQAGQSFWQVLPLCNVDGKGSPYSSYSTFAGNFCFIDLDILRDEGILKGDDYKSLDWGRDEERLDFSKVIKNRLLVLKRAYFNCKEEIESDLINFIKENRWVKNYALFMVLLEKNYYKAFWEWDEKFKNRNEDALKRFEEENRDYINFWIFLQFKFFNQLEELKKYANRNKIKIIGDLPIYVSGNSSDVWENPQNFCLNENKTPKKVSGCPPDAFSKDGQLWGNPVYDWDEMKKDGFSWWENRLKQYIKMYDYIRLDHFRGFDEYYEIDAKEKTAKNGVWKKGPGLLFFKEMEKKLGRLKIIAEDLGFLTNSVKKLLKDVKFPGMQILEHSFDDKEKGEKRLPEEYEENRVLYIGTHDNNTALGWFKGLDLKSKNNLMKYFKFKDEKDMNWKLIEESMKTSCFVFIMQMQDILGIDEKGRMNVPGTIENNWSWRIKKNLNLDKEIKKLYDLTKSTNRNFY